MQHYPAAAFNYAIHHASYLAAGLIECAMGGVAKPRILYTTSVCVCVCVCVGGVDRNGKLHLGGMWRQAGVYGMYSDV